MDAEPSQSRHRARCLRCGIWKAAKRCANRDATVGFRRDNWTVSLFGDNLANSHASTFTSSTERIKQEIPVRPLTYGVKVGVSF